MSETTATSPKDTEKSTFRELWQGLDHNQRRFAIAMLDSKSKKEAAEAIELRPNTVYGWNGEVDTVVEMMQAQVRDATLEILSAEGPRAAGVKVAGLDSDDERVRQASATEILDRVLGKPTQRQEVTGADAGPVEVKQTGMNAEEEKAAMDVFYRRVLAEVRARSKEGDQPEA